MIKGPILTLNVRKAPFLTRLAVVVGVEGNGVLQLLGRFRVVRGGRP